MHKSRWLKFHFITYYYTVLRNHDYVFFLFVAGSNVFNLVIQSANERSLWNTEAVRDLCELESYVMRAASYVNTDCKPISLATQIGILRDKTCDNLEDVDV